MWKSRIVKGKMWKFLCKQEGYLSFLFHGSIDCDVEQCMFLVFNMVLCVCLFQKLECSLFFASRVGLLSLLWVEGEHNVWKICVMCICFPRVPDFPPPLYLMKNQYAEEKMSRIQGKNWKRQHQKEQNKLSTLSMIFLLSILFSVCKCFFLLLFPFDIIIFAIKWA